MNSRPAQKDSRTERMARVDPAFLISGPHLAGLGDAVVMGTQLRADEGWEADFIAARSQHRTANIVMKNHARRARARLERRGHGRARSSPWGLVEENRHILCWRVGQGDDKAGQTAAGASEPGLRRSAPNRLALFLPETYADGTRSRPLGPQNGDGVMQLHASTLITAFAEHLIYMGGV